ncbi:cytoplasmic dynein 2 heavy chain 1 isoform X3, partial [Tachysurus ichikawai]
FLAKRGVREDIVTFDARNITHEIRESVEELLHRNRASFDPKNAKRASAAAAPLAAWVKANVQYSHVLEKIQPLETEQAGLMENLRKTESRMSKLEAQLNSVGERVAELKDKFQCRTTEAAKLEADVSRAQETISAAEKLIHQLDGEHIRWSTQVDEIGEELKTLPKRVQLAAAFITYLSATPEDQRRSTLHSWMEQAGLQKFDLQHFLCSESEQLIWKSEGLPSDDLSMENALVILQELVNSSVVGQQVCVGQDDSSVCVGSVSLPRRAETFGGFDCHQMNISKNGDREEADDLRRTESDSVLKKVRVWGHRKPAALTQEEQ